MQMFDKNVTVKYLLQLLLAVGWCIWIISFGCKTMKISCWLSWCAILYPFFLENTLKSIISHDICTSCCWQGFLYIDLDTFKYLQAILCLDEWTIVPKQILLHTDKYGKCLWNCKNICMDIPVAMGQCYIPNRSVKLLALMWVFFSLLFPSWFLEGADISLDICLKLWI